MKNSMPVDVRKEFIDYMLKNNGWPKGIKRHIPKPEYIDYGKPFKTFGILSLMLSPVVLVVWVTLHFIIKYW